MAALLYASRAENCPYELALVASDKPDAPGLELARAEGVPVFAAPQPWPGRAEWERLLENALSAADVQLLALAGYMRLLSPGFVDAWAGRIVNVHPSLLPKYKGLDTHIRALEAGDAYAGCSVHLVTAEVDAGEVLAQIPVAILPGDTPDSLAARVLIAEHQLYPRTLARFISREG